MADSASRRKTPDHDRGQPSTRKRKDAGFSLTELMVVANILGLLASIMTPVMIDQIEKARLARCIAEMHGIQNAIFLRTTPGTVFPQPSEFWEATFPGATRGLYYYLLDGGDFDNGHGNEIDGFDEENPGNNPPDVIDIQFVILCQHNHGRLCKYVYLEDMMPPKLATEDNDPGYDRFIKWEDGRKPPPGGGKKPK